VAEPEMQAVDHREYRRSLRVAHRHLRGTRPRLARS
jgi:hypothetical protein